MASKGQQPAAQAQQAAPTGQIKHFDNLRTILRNSRHTSGQDLYQHLVDVMNHIVLHCPENGLDQFEEISYLLKRKEDINLADFLKIDDVKLHSKPDPIHELQTQKFLAKAKKLFEKGGQAGEGGEEEQAQTDNVPIGYVPDLLGDSKIYQWAGIGFGENETLLLQKSLKGLSASTGAGNIRLWGKIQGLERDYYITEGTFDGNQGDEEKPADFEARGSGVNKFVYWASNSPLDAWTQLPDLLPKDIQAAREVKVNFTGDLERPIFTNPFFFKKEKHYLRAQIARITHSTTIVPRSLFRTVEDNDKEIEENTPNEGNIVIPSTEEMKRVDMWVHYTQNILFCNRLAHIDQSDGDDTGEIMKKIEAADPYEKRLKPIALDKKVKGGLPSWVVKLCGESSTFANANPALGKINYGVVVVKSLQWPGSFSFFNQGRYLQVYVGDGLKYEQETYYPIFPPHIREDPEEKTPYDEPNPKGWSEPVAQQEENAVAEEY